MLFATQDSIKERWIAGFSGLVGGNLESITWFDAAAEAAEVGTDNLLVVLRGLLDSEVNGKDR